MIHHTKPRTLAGFTLIELMVTVAMVAILAAIALPSYQNQIRKSRRTEAKSALLDLAGREEKLFSTTNSYNDVAANLGYSSLNPVGSGYYKVDVTIPGAAPFNTFTLTATPLGGQAQDSTCASFSVNQAGLQTAQDNSGTDTTDTCWK